MDPRQSKPLFSTTDWIRFENAQSRSLAWRQSVMASLGCSTLTLTPVPKLHISCLSSSTQAGDNMSLFYFVIHNYMTFLVNNCIVLSLMIYPDQSNSNVFGKYVLQLQTFSTSSSPCLSAMSKTRLQLYLIPSNNIISERFRNMAKQ